jgi:hypothetical protein
LAMILGAVLLLSAAKPAAATIVITDDYYVTSAYAFSSLYGTDSDQQEGQAPVSASANIQGALANSAAWANSEMLAVASGAAATVIQPPDGPILSISLGTAANAMFTLKSDTAWTLGVEASSSTYQFGNANTQAAAAARVFDAQNNQLYLYDLSVDGTGGSYDFVAGDYKLLLLAASTAVAGTCPDGLETAGAESTVELTVDLIPVPEPATIALLAFGTLAFLRKNN